MNVDLIQTIVAVVLGIYEVFARLIPSVNDWSILGNIIRFLKVISDWLNNLKK